MGECILRQDGKVGPFCHITLDPSPAGDSRLLPPRAKMPQRRASCSSPLTVKYTTSCTYIHAYFIVYTPACWWSVRGDLTPAQGRNTRDKYPMSMNERGNLEGRGQTLWRERSSSRISRVPFCWAASKSLPIRQRQGGRATSAWDK